MTVRAKKRPSPGGLSHAAIAAAALRVIDREGIDAFSTRKLGAALGVEAMAIYWYYPSKDALLDAVVEKLVEPLQIVVAEATADDWIAALRDLAHAYRKISHEHPKAFPLLATRRFASEGTYAFMEQLFELAQQARIPDQIAARFYRVVSSYCNGFALNELATLHGAAPATAALRKRFTRVSAVSKWLEAEHLDEMFEFGLELHLSALARESK